MRKMSIMHEVKFAAVDNYSLTALKKTTARNTELDRLVNIQLYINRRYIKGTTNVLYSQ